jgi:hypothetical protein
LAKKHSAEQYGPCRHIFSVWGKGGTSLARWTLWWTKLPSWSWKSRVQLQRPSDHACPLLLYDHVLQGSRV